MAKSGRKFDIGGLKGNPYGNVEEQPTVEQAEAESAKPAKTEYYRFNLKMPMTCKDYLQEMAWKTSTRDNPVTITSYIVALIEKDMEANPNWADGLDETNR